MPMELLRELVQLPLPVTLTDPADIDKARLLRAADQIACTISAGEEPCARVLAITKEGRAALALHHRLQQGEA